MNDFSASETENQIFVRVIEKDDVSPTIIIFLSVSFKLTEKHRIFRQFVKRIVMKWIKQIWFLNQDNWFQGKCKFRNTFAAFEKMMTVWLRSVE